MGLYLPQENGCPDVPCLRLDDVLKRSRPWQLSINQGLNVATILCTRTIQHIKMMNYSDPLDRNHYNFWTQHYHLDEAIRYVADSTSADSVDGLSYSSDDASSNIDLKILLKATATCLHGALLVKADAEVSAKGSSKQAMQAQASEALILQNSLDIAHLIQASVSTEAAKINIFLPWAIYVAIQSLIRHRHRSTSMQARVSSPRSSSVCTSSSSFLSSTGPDDVSFSFPSSFNSTGSLHAFPGNSSCVRCGIATDTGGNASTSSFGGEDRFLDTLTEAIVLDSMNALRSSLVDLSDKSPLSKFFDDEVETEMVALGERMVGLAAFIKVK